MEKRGMIQKRGKIKPAVHRHTPTSSHHCLFPAKVEEMGIQSYVSGHLRQFPASRVGTHHTHIVSHAPAPSLTKITRQGAV